MIDFFTEIYRHLLDPSRFPVAILALALVALAGAVTGPMHGNANPFLWAVIDKLFGGMGSRLDRRERKPPELVTRGFVLTVVVLMFGWLVGETARRLSLKMPAHGATEIVLLSLTLTGGAVWYALLKLFFALKDKKVGKGSYYMIARSARADLSNADDYTITRAGMGYAARAFDKGVVAPVLWYLLAGLPGVYIYAALAAIAAHFGRDGFTKGFGRVMLALEKLMGFVPSALAGVIIVLAGLFTPTGGMTRAIIGLLKSRPPYEQGGWPVAAMAGALNVSLGGPVTDLDGRSLPRAWIGPENATARLENGHLRRALYITLMAYLLFMASLAGGLAWSGLFPY